MNGTDMRADQDRLVSVITCCYNMEAYIGETIRSVQAQTYPDWEMIVVDDGSTDGSAAAVQALAENEPRIRLIRQENRGSAAARNVGIRAARGRYIALLDADDLWHPDFLEKQLSFMADRQAVCVFASYRRIDEQSRDCLKPVICRPAITVRDMRVMNHIGCLTGLYDTKPHGKVYLKEELNSIRDDYAYWYDIVSAAGSAYGNREPLAAYRVTRGSTTGNKRRLIPKQYRFYREYLHESAPQALINTIRWGLSGLRKFSLGAILP